MILLLSHRRRRCPGLIRQIPLQLSSHFRRRSTKPDDQPFLKYWLQGRPQQKGKESCFTLIRKKGWSYGAYNTWMGIVAYKWTVRSCLHSLPSDQLLCHVLAYANMLLAWQLPQKRAELLKLIEDDPRTVASDSAIVSSHLDPGELGTRIKDVQCITYWHCNRALQIMPTLRNSWWSKTRRLRNMCDERHSSPLLYLSTTYQRWKWNIISVPTYSQAHVFSGLSYLCSLCSHVSHIKCWRARKDPLCAGGCGCICTQRNDNQWLVTLTSRSTWQITIDEIPCNHEFSIMKLCEFTLLLKRLNPRKTNFAQCPRIKFQVDIKLFKDRRVHEIKITCASISSRCHPKLRHKSPNNVYK